MPFVSRIIVNKIENKLVLLKNITSPCCGDRGRLHNLWRLHSPMQLNPLEAGGRGGVMVSVFFYVLLVCCCWSVSLDVGCGFECTLLVC